MPHLVGLLDKDACILLYPATIEGKIYSTILQFRFGLAVFIEADIGGSDGGAKPPLLRNMES